MSLAIPYNPKLIKKPQMRLANLFGKNSLCGRNGLMKKRSQQSFNWQTLLKEQMFLLDISF